MVEDVGDDGFEYGVAEEFESFVVFLGGVGSGGGGYGFMDEGLVEEVRGVWHIAGGAPYKRIKLSSLAGKKFY